MTPNNPADESSLTPRQQQVLALLRQGLSHDEIADRVGISPGGLQYHLDNIAAALGVSSADELTLPSRQTRPGAGMALRFVPQRLRRFGLGFKLAAAAGVVAIVVAAGYVALRPDLTGGASSVSLGKLAYIDKGDLWVTTLPDGKPQRSVTGGTYTYPRWSASGQWLSIDQPPNTTIMRPDGSDQHTSNGCGIWSPVDDVLTCSAGTVVRVVAADGSQLASYDLSSDFSALPQDGVINSYCFTWSNDGHSLACRVIDYKSSASRVVYSGVWVVSVDTGAAQELVGRSDGVVDVPFGWTKDDKLVLFVASGPDWLQNGQPVYSVPATGGEAIPQNRTATLLADVPGPGDRAVATDDEHDAQSWTKERIALVNEASGKAQYLTGTDTASMNAQWSPDYKHLVYVSAPDAGQIDGLAQMSTPTARASGPAAASAMQAMAQRHIWIMDADGSNKRQLTSNDQYRDEAPAWSKQGNQILFSRVDQAGKASVWVVSASGGTPTKVADLSPCDAQTERCIDANSAGLVYQPFEFGLLGAVDWSAVRSWWQPKP